MMFCRAYVTRSPLARDTLRGQPFKEKILCGNCNANTFALVMGDDLGHPSNCFEPALGSECRLLELF